MMEQNEQKEAAEVLQLISKDFDRPGIDSVITLQDVETFIQLKEYLTHKLAYLLDHNFNKLVNTLYLIDIDEQKIKNLFEDKNRDYIPSKLADLVIERQLQKLYFRRKYKMKKD